MLHLEEWPRLRVEEVHGSWKRSRMSASKEQQGAKGGYLGMDGGNI